MPRRTPFTEPFDQLPPTLPVFPLANAVVLPGGYLPLNIFEPRYLNMVQDAMASHRLVGMIQPRDDSATPDLYQVGCAGRIIRYAETADGRLEIGLSGICRFTVTEELDTTRGYRLVRPDWSNYSVDYTKQDEPAQTDRQHFTTLLKAYLERNALQADWASLDQVPAEELINNLVSVLPLNEADRQLLLETDTLDNRLRAFSAILEGGLEAPGVRH
jgi:hypothetical protein